MSVLHDELYNGGKGFKYKQIKLTVCSDHTNIKIYDRGERLNIDLNKKTALKIASAIQETYMAEMLMGN